MKTLALIIAAGILTLASNAFADTTDRPLPAHVSAAPMLRPVGVVQMVRVSDAAARPLTQGAAVRTVAR